MFASCTSNKLKPVCFRIFNMQEQVQAYVAVIGSVM
jgi:hypothetical protein